MTAASRSRSRGRDRCGHRASLGRDLGLGARALVGEAAAVSLERLLIGGEAPVAELEVGQDGAGSVMSLPALAFLLSARRQVRGDGGCRGFRCLEIGHGDVRLALGPHAPLGRLGRPGRGLVPAGMGRREQRADELVADRRAGRLLLGLGRQPTSLRPELGEDVVDAGQVGLGFGELLLGLAAATLMAPDPGHLLEQRAALLRAEGERLVDHPLADEQEGVVGQVRAVEQVDEVAQPDPLLD